MITAGLYRVAAEAPDRTFLYFEDREFSYRVMANIVDSLEYRLRGEGVVQGQPVALICRNRPAYLAVWFALSNIGAICVPLNTGLVGDGLNFALGQSGAKLLLIEPELLQQKRETVADDFDRSAMILVDEAMETPPTDKAVSAPDRVSSASEPNSILYTSGTTGFPKGAIIPAGNYLQSGNDMVAALGISEHDRIMVFLPLFHANPQMYAVMSALTAGCALVLLPKFVPDRFFDEVERYQPTGFTYVGTILSLIEKRNTGERRGHSLKWCVGGGAPPAIWDAMESRFGVSVYELYGMTETGGWVSLNTPDQSRRGSVGKARAEIELRIANDDDAAVPSGTPGEILIRAKRPFMIFDGYLKNSDATVAATRNLWLHTGDSGFLDEDGFLHFVGRLKELIRRGGEMVSPVEVELQLLKHPAVRDCAVVGVEDEVMGEEIKAAVVAAETVDPHELRAFLSENLPPQSLPRYFQFVETIPKTETEKIRRNEVANLPGEIVDLRKDKG